MNGPRCTATTLGAGAPGATGAAGAGPHLLVAVGTDAGSTCRDRGRVHAATAALHAAADSVGAGAEPAPPTITEALRGVLAVLGDRRGRRLVGAACAASLLAVSGCGRAEEVPQEQDGDVVLAEVLAEPRNHIGETLRLEAVIGTMITDDAFTVVDEASTAPEEAPEERHLVVVGPTAGLEEGDPVVVEGTVEEALEPEELEERYGSQWTDLMGEEYGGEAWLDAETVELAD